MIRKNVISSKKINIFATLLITGSLLFYLVMNVSSALKGALQSGQVQQTIALCLSEQLMGCQVNKNSAKVNKETYYNYLQNLEKLEQEKKLCISSGKCSKFCTIVKRVQDLGVPGFENWNMRFNVDLHPSLKEMCFSSGVPHSN